jgi:hypothetical protein
MSSLRAKRRNTLPCAKALTFGRAEVGEQWLHRQEARDVDDARVYRGEWQVLLRIVRR